MLKVLDTFPVGNNTSVTISGDGADLKNGEMLQGERTWVTFGPRVFLCHKGGNRMNERFERKAQEIRQGGQFLIDNAEKIMNFYAKAPEIDIVINIRPCKTATLEILGERYLRSE